MRLVSLRRIAPLLVGGLLFTAAPPGVASGGEPAAPGLHEVVVYDSAAHERGLPAVQFKDGEQGLQVEIPPAVHVHRYYYSGDKEIQGPIVSGGPTIVVANHPKTGERMYVDVMLPQGAPKIAYDANSITYVYPDKRVSIKFQHFPFDPCVAVVRHHGGKGVARNVEEFHEKVSQHTHEHFAQSKLAQSAKDAAASTGGVVKGAAGAAGDAAACVLDFMKSNVDRLPGAVPLKSAAEGAPERKRAAEIQRAARLKQDEARDFVRTNR